MKGFALKRPSYLQPKLPPKGTEISTALRWLREGPLKLTAERHGCQQVFADLLIIFISHFYIFYISFIYLKYLLFIF